jgi:hypothetical protein
MIGKSENTEMRERIDIVARALIAGDNTMGLHPLEPINCKRKETEVKNCYAEVWENYK